MLEELPRRSLELEQSGIAQTGEVKTSYGVAVGTDVNIALQWRQSACSILNSTVAGFLQIARRPASFSAV
jgi:hypothetical protein